MNKEFINIGVELKDVIEDIISFQKVTFPKANLANQMEKFEEETEEFLKETDPAKKIEELVDMFIVSIGVSEMSPAGKVIGFSLFNTVIDLQSKLCETLTEFKEAIQKKMEINKARTWVFENNIYHHIDK
jgi:hypothetical protein